MRISNYRNPRALSTSHFAFVASDEQTTDTRAATLPGRRHACSIRLCRVRRLLKQTLCVTALLAVLLVPIPHGLGLGSSPLLSELSVATGMVATSILMGAVELASRLRCAT